DFDLGEGVAAVLVFGRTGRAERQQHRHQEEQPAEPGAGAWGSRHETGSYVAILSGSDGGVMLAMRAATRSSSVAKGSRHSTVRPAWSFSFRCAQSTV